MLKKPITISEKLMYCTTRLLSPTGSGTGYFINLHVADKIYPALVTNQHVLNYKMDEHMVFMLHLADSEGNPGENITVQFDMKWYPHPTHDLCFAFVNPLLEEIRSRFGRPAFVLPVSDEIIASQTELEQLQALEELVMVGYPIGLWDEAHNLPIFRKGFTATHPAIDFFNSETGITLPGIGVVDMACFNGSSGSPVFVLNENGYSDRDGTTYIGAKRLMLIGTLFAGPMINERGSLTVETIPTSQSVVPVTPVKTNLGYIIKSTQFDEFKAIIQTIE